ncbi:MAG: carboxypeptidase-like regulatory domain-containing protein, partial [Mucilaginibacter sp.]|nr:carboxypeptidase-like regulatory domain-containing protein [Mucilaginibacter sp.]
MKILYYLFFALLAPVAGFAQYTISGRVLNQADTKPVPYASVFLSNATNGDKTSVKGTFLLQNVKPGSYELVVSMVGFEFHSQLITITDADVKLPEITIYPKTIQLNEVKIKPVNDALRDKYLQLFKNEFLGTTNLAKDCKILNPEVLDFDYNDTTGTLKASAADFLKIKNDDLGYNISYLITNFKVTNKQFFEKDFAYKGFVLFEEMEGTPAQKKHWLKARQEAYENSSAHFLRVLLTDHLEDEGFKVQQIAVYPNPARPADSLIKAKIKLYTGSKSGSGKDSLAAWIKRSNLNKTLLKLYKFPLRSNEIVQRTEKVGTYVLGCDSDALYICYNKHKNFDKEGRLQNVNDPYNRENSIISFNSRYAFFDDNGWISNPESVTFSGVWGNKRVADLLPKNYEYNGIKNIEADTGLTAMTGKLNDFATKYPIEKAYLQTDKSNYDVFDTIWYKAYTVAGQQHQLSALSGVLYAELINAKDSVALRQVLHLTSGAAWGDMVLTGAVKQGDYQLRAYTNWMRNAGPEYFFNKKIHVGGYEAAPPVKQTVQANPDVQFFPEGGELVTGLRSKVAVKSIAPNGLGLDINGTIVDNEGNVIVDFATQHLGMGAFAFTPQSGKTYKARIKTGIGETAFEVELPKAKEAGFTLGINNSSPDSIFLKVAANEALFQQKQHSAFYVIAQTGGKV